MGKAATDIYTFENLRKGGFTYVDKTAILKELADLSRGKQFFIARPRRFGKSLAVSTLKCLFEGRRDLFEGLAIEPEWDWSRKWPVIHLDMRTMQYDTVDELSDAIASLLNGEAARLGVSIERKATLPETFRDLIIKTAATSDDGQCVVLVDDYEKPLWGHLMKPEVVAFRDFLAWFYGVMKYEERYQRFTFITGVSKFSKASIFSELNNVKDYTLSTIAGTLFGYTHDEVRRYFPDCLAALGEKLGKTPDGAFAEIVKWCGEYKFQFDAEPVIDPVAFGITLNTMQPNNWRSKTTTPSFLIDLFRKKPIGISDLTIEESDLDSHEPDKIKPVTLLFQTGYLTIKGFEQSGADRTYHLGIPNLEVENSFLKSLAGVYVGQDDTDSSNISRRAREALRARDPEGFVEAFRQFFAAIPYDLTDRQNEQSWQAIMYVVLRVIGINVGGEVRTHKGRIDLTVETETDAYIIEVKRDSTAKKAIEQIHDKSYTDRFRPSGKPITLIGIAFSTKKRTVSGVKIVRNA